jgi:hypothetical protein
MLRVVAAAVASKARKGVGRGTNSTVFALRSTQTLIEWLRLIAVNILNSLMLAKWYGR